MPRRKSPLILMSAAATAALAATALGAATRQTKTISADKTKLAFTTQSIVAKPGTFTLKMANPSTTKHNIAVRGGQLGFAKVGKSVLKGGTSEVTFTARAGKTYTFFCQIPGHETAGMRGKIVVK